MEIMHTISFFNCGCSDKIKLSRDFVAKCQHCSSKFSVSLKATPNFIAHLRVSAV